MIKVPEAIALFIKQTMILGDAYGGKLRTFHYMIILCDRIFDDTTILGDAYGGKLRIVDC
ncbi:MAG: hypothetical protein HWQ41_09480 [Nostoc sp. NOS(2021)]|uniref:hypothetical protein n=1 Tax=Nostoc sp. NOS(2021) TaxID=2815407 RepID=UPI0025E62500|nr:hypothetical protein [Nostoc sp. NOS(2021)]MBN3895479.1 hypothetical protein [Nostoc sp. NOS(2021)]